MKLENIPPDLNAEVLLDYLEPGSFAVKFCGLHKRNSYRDVQNIEQVHNRQTVFLGRNSIYNSLPEYVFHSIDRFDHIPQRDRKEKFAEEYAKQEEEKERAYKYFAPIDTLLLQVRLKVREILRAYVDTNTIVQDILLDKLSVEQRDNRFIRKTIPYITSCKSIRGNRTLITLLLRKVLMEEGVHLSVQRKPTDFTDANPRYDDSEGAAVGAVYAGNSFQESTLTYTLAYWAEDECNEDFLRFLHDIETYRQFVQDYFLSVDSLLVFDLTKEEAPLRISDTTKYNYLNYNANL